MSAPIDWPGLMRLGIVRLGLRPEEFWRLTPAELWLMLGDTPGRAPLGRARLDALMRAYPDHHGGDDNG